MRKKNPREHIQPDRPQGMIQLMVTLARPDPKELAGYDRARKFQLLQDNSMKRRADLVAWLREQDLANQVAKVGEPTAFNVLFITATPAVAKRLTDAPGVLSVSPTEEFKVGLTNPARKGPPIDLDDSGEGG
jgi:hypothetical protein